ncbi:hypothetical protein FACS1894198_5400 [Clostridia bacterium]|nr:hypothetical protein FACS1894198_5400 [Clostridia bacterium]
MLEEKAKKAEERTLDEQKVPKLTADYKVTVENYISFNFLLIGKRIKRSKTMVIRNFIIMTLLIVAVFVINIKKKSVTLGLFILWMFVLLNFVQGMSLKKRLIASSKKAYDKDDYSRYNVKLDLCEDRLVETTFNSNTILFGDIELTFEDETIFAVYSKKKRTFIIPKCEKTKKILNKLNMFKPTAVESLDTSKQIDLMKEATSESNEPKK